MAREVNTVLAQILAESRGVSEAKGEEIVKNMRAANQYQVCISNWAFFFQFNSLVNYGSNLNLQEDVWS